MSNKENVIVVGEKDEKIKNMKRNEVHKKGILHRAVSVFIFNKKKDKLLLQKRSKNKDHSIGLWTNTCCTHTYDNESILEAANRSLYEEMGIKIKKLKKKFEFIYKAKLEKGIIENELDHVFFGTYEKDPKINKQEVEDWKWIKILYLKKNIKKNSSIYTVWFKIIFEKIIKNKLI
ncbi:isopentenyl-diphosphate Delta-isomerase [Candidatus Shikimatogenerans silvanidophilus]|uniref:isopentenyl-diphosphate Delta-isomerase n=1 Tax=Candidatus Shikimatogenerans silvanidophilus TaxID=2782547 RepID=UPI001BAB19F6|nr:isopentenyl-diphosphate Delta-isomerase [Candidatus Shikimatogenerans silvanidophilus]